MPIKHTHFTLKNKMPVILAPTRGTQAFTILILYKVGSRNEPEEIAGISHFLEHLFFKGTKKRPHAIDISKELDGIGAEYNAFTSREYTGYYIKAHTDHFGLATDVISDMLYHATIPAEELERERGVILEEYNMYQDNPMANLENVYEELVHAGNSLGRDVIGYQNTIKSITREQVADYRESFYDNTNGIVVVAGNIPRNAKAVLAKHFSEVRTASGAYATAYAPFQIRQDAPAIKLHHKETQQAHLGIGFPTFGMEDARMPALELLSGILGAGMSSRLFIEVRERRGLCYYVGSSVNKYQDAGNIFIRAGLDTKKIDEAVEVILKELKKMRDDGVTADELKKAKEFFKGHITLGMEDSENVAQYYASRYLFQNKIEPVEKRIEKLLAVTRDDIAAVARDVIAGSKLNFAMIGPFADSAQFERLLTL